MGELIVNGIKWAFIIGCATTFMVAIYSIISAISQFVVGDIVSELFSVFSMCLPFDANAVFVGIGVSIAAIISFMIAKKLYSLTTEHIKI